MLMNKQLKGIKVGLIQQPTVHNTTKSVSFEIR